MQPDEQQHVDVVQPSELAARQIAARADRRQSRVRYAARERRRVFRCSTETLENRLLLSVSPVSDDRQTLPAVSVPVSALVGASMAGGLATSAPALASGLAISTPGSGSPANSGSPAASSSNADLTDLALGGALPRTPPRPLVPLAYNALGPMQVTVRAAGTDVEIIDTPTRQILASQPLAQTSEIDVNGIAHSVNTLTVDFSGGAIPLAINYDGGTGGDNTLVVSGGTFAQTSYFSSGPHSGTITLDSTVINYTNLTPIVDDTQVNERVFTDTASNDQIELSAASSGPTRSRACCRRPHLKT